MHVEASFLIGVGVGLAIGFLLLAVWTFWMQKRVLTRHTAMMEQMHRTDSLAEELRRRLQEEQAVTRNLRQQLLDSHTSCAVAETQRVEAMQRVQENQALLRDTKQQLEASFQALSGEALRQNNEAFLQLARSSFAGLQREAQGDLGLRQQAICDLLAPLSQQLTRYEEQIRQLEQSRLREQGGLEQHLKSMAESQQRLQQETGKLVNALRAPAIRGRWGEMTLRRVAELSGMVAYCDFIEQAVLSREESLFRPDLVVRLPAGRQVIVDAKTVLAAYLDAYECQNEHERADHLARHAAQVRSRMEELSLKGYWNQFSQAPEFVVLFLPGEQFLGAALEQDPSLIEDGFARGVVIATPTTLVALLRAVAYGWRQEQLAEHAATTGRLGKELYERMAVLAEHVSDIGQSLGRSVQAYNKAIASLESRILPAARKFKDLGVSSDRDLPLLDPVEAMPRIPASWPSIAQEKV
jgi:DNA recombination protein RmuC